MILITTLVTVLFAPLIQSPPTQSGQKPPIGFVVEVRGEWVHATGSQIQGGQDLFAGARIRLKTLDRNARLTVSFYDGSVEVYAPPKNVEVVLPLTVVSLPPLSVRALEAARVLLGLFSKTGNTVPALGRGLALPDSVARIDGNRIDLHDLARRVAPGDYSFEVRPVSETYDVGSALTLSPITWKARPDGPSSIEIQGIQAGLYKLVLRGDPKVEGVDSYLLLLTRSGYEKCQPEFDALVQLTGKWSRERSEDRIRLQRAYLFGRATEIRKELR